MTNVFLRLLVREMTRKSAIIHCDTNLDDDLALRTATGVQVKENYVIRVDKNNVSINVNPA